LIINPVDIVEPLIMVTRKGEPKLAPMADVPNMGRSVQGKPVAETAKNDPIVAIQQIPAPTSPSSSDPAGRRPPEPTAVTAGPEPKANMPRAARQRPPATKPGKLELNIKTVTATAKKNNAETPRATTAKAGKVAPKESNGRRTKTAAASGAKAEKTASKESQGPPTEKAATPGMKVDKAAPKRSKARLAEKVATPSAKTEKTASKESQGQATEKAATPGMKVDKAAPKRSKARLAEKVATPSAGPKAASRGATADKTSSGRGEQVTISARTSRQPTATVKHARGQPAAPQPAGASTSAATATSKPSSRTKSAVETKTNAGATAKPGVTASGRNKGAKQNETPVQSALFAADTTAVNESTSKKKSNKVQAVVSVPAGQVSQPKRKK
jgi:hypothetical protein